MPYRIAQNGPSHLREYRIKAELSQEALARLANVAKNSIYLWEHGRIPSDLTQNKLANALGVPVEEIWPTEVEA